VASPVTINIPHALGKDEARRRIAAGFGRVREQIPGSGMIAFSDRWDADRLHFEGSALGQKITGRVDVGVDAVQMQLDLPEFLAAIASRIVPKLQDEARKLLERKERT
jgi:Putative polyhydroxyalkanoic acid system protein (PHA_gran_rgn)